MSNDSFKEVLFTPGEGGIAADWNDMQRFTRALLADAFLEKLIPGPPQGSSHVAATTHELVSNHGNNAPTSQYAYALQGGQAYPTQGSGNNKVKITAGTLLQKIAARDGDKPSLLAYTFDGTEEVSIANGDATNPRVDLIQMKLETEDGDLQARVYKDTSSPPAILSANFNKKRRVKCTLLVKQGTAAASPTYPTLDAGYVAIAAVVVGAVYVAAAGLKTIDTAGAVAVLHDQRMPLGCKATTVHPRNIYYDPATWTLGAKSEQITAGAAATNVYVHCPRGGHVGRFLAIEAATSHNGTGENLNRYNYSDAGPNLTTLNDTVLFDGTATIKQRKDDLGNALTHHPAAGPTVLANAAGMGAPIWTNGRRAIALSDSSPLSFDQLAWLVSGAVNGTRIGPVTWYIAEGL